MAKERAETGCIAVSLWARLLARTRHDAPKLQGPGPLASFPARTDGGAAGKYVQLQASINHATHGAAGPGATGRPSRHR